MRWWMLVGMAVVWGCDGHSSSGCDCWDTAGYNAAVACAGEDQWVALGQVVILDASCSQSDFWFPEVLYTWHLEAQPPSSALTDEVFGDANRSSAAGVVSFMPDVVGQYAISLTVDDQAGCPDTPLDVVVITVVEE